MTMYFSCDAVNMFGSNFVMMKIISKKRILLLHDVDSFYLKVGFTVRVEFNAGLELMTLKSRSDLRSRV